MSQEEAAQKLGAKEATQVPVDEVGDRISDDHQPPGRRALSEPIDEASPGAGGEPHREA